MATEEYKLETLEEYLQFYKRYGIEEKEILKQFIVDKELELDYSNMIMELVQTKLYKKQYEQSKAKEVILYYNDCCGQNHNTEWTNEENVLWDKWVIEYALNFELSESTKEVVKQKVPQMIAPNWGFRGLLAYINKECGVLFKGQVKADDFDLLKVPQYNPTLRW